ncbi:MAG TPA: tRNA (adenosine(37)-N6)-dimethylallyltransferase MiaA [Ruminococcaceae bacterium]|nr:tRNA (adenosine(37)-N6)-dimethylallyltransferase MiaA [Oscillospiraceae bacterium]
MKLLILEDHPYLVPKAVPAVEPELSAAPTESAPTETPEQPKKKLIAIVGPTASGKTALAIELAKKYNGEVVSADSMQIYKGMEIASAKPTEEEMQGIPHHLMSFLDPSETFSVSDFVRLATEAIEDILDRGKMPIVCGGAGLYIRSLLDNVTFTAEEPDEALRAELTARYETEGGEALLAELATFDPETAEKLSPNDGKRIVRAIEIYRTTGITMSEQISLSKLTPSPYDVTVIGLTFEDRQNLYDRINRRVDEMLLRGLLPEADRFYSSEKSVTSSAAIGYKELKPYLDGKITLDAATEKLKMESRRYAKRQITWFKRDEYIHWIMVDRCEDVVAEAEKIIETHQ